MEHLEIEVKFYITNVDLMCNNILGIGAYGMGRVHETNLCFDNNKNDLMQKNSLLRLRKDRSTTLTFKSLPVLQDKNFKVLNELEVEVSNFSTAKLILESLGFFKKQIYEKMRETFVIDNAKLCMDTLPFGTFLEIEDEKKNIKDISSRIGLDWGKRITTNYLEIFDRIKQKLNLTFVDVTFDNFKNLNVDFEALLYELDVVK